MTSRDLSDHQTSSPAPTEDDGPEYRACLALRHTPGLGPKTWKTLLDHYGSARAAQADVHAWSGLGLARKTQADAFIRNLDALNIDEEWRAVRDRHQTVITYNDPRYPAYLRNIPDPPVCLYCKGRLELLCAPSLAVVGSRDSSRYGVESARAIARDLSRSGVTIISGFAHGIDRQAHLAGLEGPGSSVAVLGTGLDLVYPAGNRDLWTRLAEHGLIVTEFAPGTRPEPKNFPWRNRIISGLSLGVLVVEAAMRSGSLITARLALEQNREVFALPGPVDRDTYSGCHALIRQGALLVQSAEDILTELAPLLQYRLEAAPASAPVRRSPARPPVQLRLDDANAPSGDPVRQHQPAPDESPVRPAPQLTEPPPDLPEEELLLLRALTPDTPRHIDELARALDWDSGRLSRMLIMLELRGLVRQLPGMRYLPA